MSIWKHIDTNHLQVACDLSVSEAIKFVMNEPSEIFVTGSLYLVGSVLTAIDWSEQEAEGRLILK